MEPNLRSVLISSVLFLSALPLLSQSRTTSSTFTVELKATPADQYKYASTIVPHARQLGLDHEEAVIEEAAALELIPQRWPNDRHYGVAAYLQAVRLLAVRYSAMALTVASRAERYVGDDAELALIQSDKATALASLGRAAEAEQVFRTAMDGTAFRKLDAGRQRVVLKQAAFFFERQKRYRDASDLMRRAAPLGTGALDAVMDYEKSLELNVNGGALAEAKVDYESVVREAARARTKKLSPQELQELPYIDRYIARYKTKLKL